MTFNQTWTLLVLFLCGIAHSNFIKNMSFPIDLTDHLWQWLPLLIGALSYLYYGWETQKDWEEHSFFGLFGILGTSLVISAVGYVVGYHYFF